MSSHRNDFYLHVDLSFGDSATTAALTRIEAALNQLASQTQTQGAAMAGEFDTLQKQVQQNHDIEESAVQLIQGIAQQLQNAQNDPAKLAALSQTLQQSASDLAAAITANTPATAPASSGDGGSTPTGTDTTGANTTSVPTTPGTSDSNV